MESEWRLIQDDIYEARHHFAVEEALARLVDEGHTPPTLRLRQVHPAVFVGVHQDTWAEVDVDYCQAQDIQIVRRMNGGGAVYHEKGSFCFSAFFPRNLFTQSEDELYRLFAIPVIRTCADFGIDTHYEGRNDVLAGNRKIYGSAHFTWYKAYVQSGTFLVNMNFDVMERALTPPALKFAGRSARSIQERVTSLSREVGREVDVHEVMGRFADHVAELLGIHLLPSMLTSVEQTLANELLAVKYSTDPWNFGSQLVYQLTVADRSDEGVISLSADIEGNFIQRAKISGDILHYDRQELEDLEYLIRGCSVSEALAKVRGSLLSASFRKTLLGLIEKLRQEVADISSIRQKEKQG